MIPGIVSAPLFASAQGMTAAATPGHVSKSQGSYGGSETLTTPSTTVTVTGGTGPYTHSWTCSDPNVSPTAPSAATTAFQATLNAGDEFIAACTDTVTDANGIVTTAECDAALTLVDFR